MKVQLKIGPSELAKALSLPDATKFHEVDGKDSDTIVVAEFESNLDDLRK